MIVDVRTSIILPKRRGKMIDDKSLQKDINDSRLPNEYLINE